MRHNRVYHVGQAIRYVDCGRVVHQSRVESQLNEQTPDQELVTAAQVALPAFEHLYRRYADDIYRFCHRRVSSDQDAADATSQIFIRALANIKSCDPQTFRPWLYAIARNIIADHYRAARPTVGLDETAEIRDSAAGPEDQALSVDENDRVHGMLGRLTEEQRAIIELRLAGLNGNEIATVLGKSRNAIDQAQFRAVARLRALLAPTQMSEEEHVR